MASPRIPKSSLPMMGGDSLTMSAPSWAVNAWTTPRVASGSLRFSGNETISSISGSGAPLAAASARMIRRTDASTRSRTPGSNVRMLRPSTACSGMMFSFVPAWNVPTVTTAAACGSTSRATTVCRRSTMALAATIGSMEFCGCEPCAPRPLTVTRHESLMLMNAPSRVATMPTGSGKTCWPKITSGRGARSQRPSASMARAPSPVSSPGWNTKTIVPAHASRFVARACAVVRAAATWKSCPQPCIVGTSVPDGSMPVSRLACARPVSSRMGRPSVSARNATTGPSPLRRIPTTPVPPQRLVSAPIASR